jgi:hypothetical protein
MTTTEFLRELEGIRSQFRWTLKPDQGQGSERRKTPRLRLAATLEDHPTLPLDPVSALCYKKAGKLVPAADSPAGASELLSMDQSEVQAILAAASDNTWEGEDGHRAPVDYLITLRSQLLDAVGTIRHVSS